MVEANGLRRILVVRTKYADHDHVLMEDRRKSVSDASFFTSNKTSTSFNPPITHHLTFEDLRLDIH
jgi:hypothetical protein